MSTDNKINNVNGILVINIFIYISCIFCEVENINGHSHVIIVNTWCLYGVLIYRSSSVHLQTKLTLFVYRCTTSHVSIDNASAMALTPDVAKVPA